MTVGDRETIRDFIENEIMRHGLLDSNALSCFDMNCTDKKHKDELLNIFETIKCILLHATEDFKFTNEKRFRIIPGWNDQVKYLHGIARKHFLLWKDRGRPLHGKLLEDMKKTRASFRSALKYCKDNESELRCKKLLENSILKIY